MRTIAAALVIAAVLAGAPQQARAQVSAGVDIELSGGSSAVDTFYDALLPYGNWVYYRPYGWAWYPYNVPLDWRPYTGGYWADTDDGWTFTCDAPWAWACYHYGRWTFDSDYGWLWIPGTEWAPAWVAWRTSDRYIGWAPLPPRFAWRAGFGFGHEDFDWDAVFPPFSFCFVEARHFCDEDLDAAIFMPEFNVSILRETRGHIDLDFDRDHHRITNRLADEGWLEREVGHPIKRVRLVDADTPEAGLAKTRGDEVRFFRPTLNPAAREHLRVAQAPSIPSASLPSDIRRRHDEELQAFEAERAARAKRLEQFQQERNLRAPQGVTSDQLRLRQDEERRAMEEQVTIQRHLLESQHQRESRTFGAPAVPPQRRFDIRGSDRFPRGGRPEGGHIEGARPEGATPAESGRIQGGRTDDGSRH